MPVHAKTTGRPSSPTAAPKKAVEKAPAARRSGIKAAMAERQAQITESFTKRKAGDTSLLGKAVVLGKKPAQSSTLLAKRKQTPPTALTLEGPASRKSTSSVAKTATLQREPEAFTGAAVKGSHGTTNGRKGSKGSAALLASHPIFSVINLPGELALKRLLQENWAARMRDREADGMRLNQDRVVDFEADDSIGRVRKENVFREEMTAMDQQIVDQRVALAQQRGLGSLGVRAVTIGQFAEFQKQTRTRKLHRIMTLHDYLSEREAIRALEDNNDDEEAAVLKLTEPDALSNLRKTIAVELNGGQMTGAKKCKVIGLTVAPNNRADAHLSDEQRQAYERLVKKRSTTLKKSATSSEKQRMYNRAPRLRLDDALRQLTSSEDVAKAMEGWSEARVRAYKLITVNPNAYYYRFNAPGEQQRNGKFTPAEHKLFMDRVREVGADGQWGIFSMAIPGRVGYQCSNYYRQLIERKVVHDPNYYIDDKGKAHYLFATKKDENGEPALKNMRTFSRKHKRAEAGGDGDDTDGSSGRSPKKSRSTPAPVKRARATKGRRKRSNDDDDDEDDDNDWDLDDLDPDRIQAEQARYKNSQWKTTKRTRTLMGEAADEEEEEQLRASNPLPGHVDPITLEEVIKPAISPYGHVMSYSSWIKCLATAEICPLTKKPLKKSDLVVLTRANIHKYADKIVKS